MIKVYQSDTGQFVLVHAPSQSFIIESSLEAGYAKLEEHLKAHHPEMVGKVLEPIDKPAESKTNSRIAQLVLIVFLALLPFVWLLVLNHSLATLLTDIQFGAETPVDTTDYEHLREDIDTLRLEQNRALQAVHSLSQTVESLTVKLEALEDAPDGATVLLHPDAEPEVEAADGTVPAGDEAEAEAADETETDATDEVADDASDA